MSVGGDVLEVVYTGDEDEAWVVVCDQHHVIHEGCSNPTAVTVCPCGYEIRPGDVLWWQRDIAYWTPLEGDRSDIPIDRVDKSHSPDDVREEKREPARASDSGRVFVLRPRWEPENPDGV